MSTTTDTLRVTCHEKGRPETFDADVAADCTASEIVSGLVSTGYLSAATGDGAYVVTNGRTGDEITANQTLAAADVKDGEVLIINKSHFGARDARS